MNPDLSKFRHRGGKLIMYHGLADTIVPPGISTTYWKSVTEKMGGAAAVSNFNRLFMVPGFERRGLSRRDALHAAEQPALCGLPPRAELDDEGAAGGELRFVSVSRRDGSVVAQSA